MRISRLGVLCLALVLCRAAYAAPVESFRFLHITDTHVTEDGGHADSVKQLVADAGKMTPVPAFVVNTGDVTELGRPAEFDHYLAAIRGALFPLYAVPGNHDARWGPLGKEGFERALGPLYRSFDHGGCHFVLLDSTVLLEHNGHFDGAELAWLQNDLKKVRKDTPVFLFFHHWLGRENPQVDNADMLLRTIGPYNVVAMFIGHGHSELQWKVNGIQCFMTRGLYQGTYSTVDVTPEQVTVQRVRKGAAATAPAPPPVTISLKRGPRYRVGFKWDDVNSPLLERRRFIVGLLGETEASAGQPKAASYAIDDGPSAAMAPSSDAAARQQLTAQFPVDRLSSGSHTLAIKLTAPDGDTYTREEAFAVERVSGQPRREWAFQTGDTIQSSPVLVDGTVYATSFDGKVYALDAKTGKRRWAASSKGHIFASPLVASGTVYVGSMDHLFYAIDAATGKVRWTFDSGAPIFATAALAEGVVCFGGNRHIYGLDAATGAQKWTQPAGGFFQSRAAADKGVFYLGGWDNTLYALDALTGQPKWKAQMGRTNGGRGIVLFYFSPAIASPTIGDGRVYVCTDDGVLHGVNAGTGKDDWIARAPKGGDGFGYSSPLYASGHVYVGGLGEEGRGNCYAFDARTGALVWNCKTGADNYDSSTALAGGLVVIGSLQGKLTWIDPATGQTRWQYGLDPGYCFSTPAADAHMTYAASMNGRVYAISTP